MAARMSDIAKLCGVSKSTVSRAFSHPEMLDKKTLERVMEFAKLYNYHPNSMAQAVAHRRSGLIGFLMFNKSRPFYGSLFYGPALDGFMERAKELEYHVLLSATTRRNDIFEESFIQDSIEGAVLITREPEFIVKVFKSRNIPVVLLNEESEEENVSCVVSDEYGGMTKIMTHLIENRGYEDIAFCSNRLSHICNMQRYFAYIDALQNHGLKPYTNPDMPKLPPPGAYRPNTFVMSRYGRSDIQQFGTPIVFSTANTASVERAMLKLLPLQKMPRVIVCANDSIAVGVCKALQKNGFRIPEDVAVTGYDDIEMASYCTPSLTTIHTDPYQMGAEAMDLLFRYIKDPNMPSERICIGNELVIRESS